MKIYFMRRRGEALVLSSINPEMFSSETPERVVIKAAGPLSEMEALSARREIRRLFSVAFCRWRQEKSYIPRFLLSSALFLFLYLFFSVVIPDPIPMLDEIVFAFLGGAALFIILSRLDERSAFVKAKMAELDEEIENASVTVTDEMMAIEEYYESLYSYSLMETASMVAHHTLPPFTHSDIPWLQDFTASLFSHLKSADSGIERTLRRIERDGGSRKTVSFLLRQVSSGSLDILDLSLYISLSSAVFNR